MKLAYTNENRFLVENARNVLENAGIETVLKNEYALGALGEIAPFETWMEVWAVKETDYDKAMAIVAEIKTPEHAGNKSAWICPECGEENAASFDLCWNCQTERNAKP